MSAYLDAELDASATAEFERYLHASPQAQVELAELRQFVRLVGGLKDVEAPPGFAEKVGRKIRRRQMWGGDVGLMALATVPFQVVTVLLVLALAVMYLVAQLEEQPRGLVRDTSSEIEQGQPDASLPGPAPIVP